MVEVQIGDTNVVYPDVALAGDRVTVVAGPTPGIWRVYGLDGTVREAQDVAGSVYFPKTDGRCMVYHDGAQYRRWERGAVATLPGAPWGNNPIGISRSGVIVYQQHPDICCDGAVVGAGQARPTGLWEVRDDRTYTRMDDARVPWAAGYAHTCGPVTVAEGADGGIEFLSRGRRGVLWPGTDTKWPRVSTDGTRAAIVCWGDLGCRLWIGTLDELEAHVHVPAPVTLPPLGRAVEVGYFFRDTTAIQYGGDNPAAPATVSVIIDSLALPAEPYEGRPVKMIIDAGCLFEMARHPEWHHLWIGTYVAAEKDVALLERMAETARLIGARLGLPPKPIVSYTGDALYPAALMSGDVIGVQAYAAVGETPSDFERRVAADLDRVRNRRVALVCQAYDRALSAWTGPRIAALQPVYWELARRYPNIEMLLLFSDGRKGGTRDYPEVRPWHVAMVRANQ